MLIIVNMFSSNKKEIKFVISNSQKRENCTFSSYKQEKIPLLLWKKIVILIYETELQNT